ncbi:MAG: Fe-S protein [Chromatiales bacterium RIFOXYA1_FULL_46_5]|nr:MAG: Fe-S protein [Chromatiales bacterium RIFOXYA1_FULL_46_5]
MESPCVACCRLNEDKICVGCYRHMDEIVDWRKKTPAEYQQISLNIQQRKAVARSLGETVPMSEAEWKAARARNAQKLIAGGAL